MISLPQDKANHFFYGAVIASVLSLYSPVIALIAVIIIAAAKELNDYLGNQKLIKRGSAPIHGVEFLDFVFTVLGALAVVLPFIKAFL